MRMAITATIIAAVCLPAHNRPVRVELPPPSGEMEYGKPRQPSLGGRGFFMHNEKGRDCYGRHYETPLYARAASGGHPGHEGRRPSRSTSPKAPRPPCWARKGDAARIDQELLEQLPGVERVMRVTEPYKKANRKYHPDDTVVPLGGGAAVGGKKLAVIAGPCSVESAEQITCVGPRRAEERGLRPCGAAPSSPAPPPMPSRGWSARVWSSSRRPRRPRACPSSPRS